MSVLVVEGVRDTYGPPHPLAFRLVVETDHFIIVRRGGGLMRWDASEWEVLEHGDARLPSMIRQVMRTYVAQ